jgi:hypothetical protein
MSKRYKINKKIKKKKINPMSKDAILNNVISQFCDTTGFKFGDKFKSMLKEKIEERMSK